MIERKSRLRGGCESLKRAGVPVDGCCSSCHEDVDYGYDLIEMDLPNGDYIWICCRVAESLDERSIQSREILIALDALDAVEDA
jgi:hypothetical protein